MTYYLGVIDLALEFMTFLLCGFLRLTEGEFPPKEKTIESRYEFAWCICDYESCLLLLDEYVFRKLLTLGGDAVVVSSMCLSLVPSFFILSFGIPEGGLC